MSLLTLNLTSDASVRGMVAPDGSHRFSVYDFITLACQKADGGVYARISYARMISDKSKFKDEIMKTSYIKFPVLGFGFGSAFIIIFLVYFATNRFEFVCVCVFARDSAQRRGQSRRPRRRSPSRVSGGGL